MPRFSFTGAFALALTAGLAGPSDAQQAAGTYQNGNCVYQTVTNPVIPHGQPGSQSSQLLGCYLTAFGRNWYFDNTSGSLRDEQTGIWLQQDANGTLHLWTTHGWQPAATHPAAQQLLRETAAANQASRQPQPGDIVLHPDGTMEIYPKMSPIEMAIQAGDENAARVLGDAQASNDRAVDRWLAPTCSGSYNGC